MNAKGGDQERHEIKFAAYETSYVDLKKWLLLHPTAFISAYPKRRVNNIYFDTWEYRAFSENLAGISERSKLRYRWYGESEGPVSGLLEVKKKRNFFGWKERFRIDSDIWYPGLRWPKVLSRLKSVLPIAGQLWLHQNPMPVMLNRYQREYFCTADGLIRATIDTNQKVFDQRHGSKPNFLKEAVMQKTLVIEFKFAREDRDIAVDLLSTIPIRVGRHSKYMNAVRSISMI